MSAILTTLYDSLKTMTVAQFAERMREVGAHNDQLTIPVFKGNGNCVVWELGHTTFSVARAASIDCKFYGGPPHQHSMYTGNLVTMFIDRLLTASIHGDFDVVDKFLQVDNE